VISFLKPRGPYGVLFAIRGGSLLIAVAVLALGWARLQHRPEPYVSTAYALESAAAGPVPETMLASIESVQLSPGEQLVQAFSEAGVNPRDTGAAIQGMRDLIDVRRVRPADRFYLYLSREGELKRVEYERPGGLDRVILEPGENGFQGFVEHKTVETFLRKLEGTVDDNLYLSMEKAGGDPGLVVNFADLFAWDFDFFTDTRNGDRFELLAEEQVVDGEPQGFGRILAARYLPKGSEQPLDAFHFTWEGDEDSGYYTHDGRSVKKAFLKSPLNYRRISSYFTTRRFHPIFKTYRPHLGVDYAAPTGTPVVALGSGRVVQLGWRNGFGNTVQVRHNGNILTQYGHLSRYAKGLHTGDRVKQGEVIGYVGMTGNATGPHLDFRVQSAGRWINPLTLKGGEAAPLPARYREEFAGTVQRADGLLDAMTPGEAIRLDGGEEALPALAQARLDTPASS
jgi:murein DD-endopeptidase MepM/ murein hydrolase activator NlpD